MGFSVTVTMFFKGYQKNVKQLSMFKTFAERRVVITIDLHGQTALITGAARGIGNAIANTLAKAGVKVVINDINSEMANIAVSNLKKEGMEALAVPADITDPQEVADMVAKVEGVWGQIDILVNNAGICPAGPLVDCTPEEWDRVFEVNCKGVYLCTRAVLPGMQERKQGTIISLASNAGKTGEPFLVPYSATKFAVVGFTQALAQEVAPDKIRVNCVCPAMAETDMMKDLSLLYTQWRGGTSEELERSFHEEIPWGRMARPEDVANAVLFLASSKAEFFTGQALNVSGGLEMH